MMMNNTGSNNNNFLNGVLLGVLVGAGVALLLTPTTGKENRRILKDKKKQLEPYIDEARPLIENLVEKSKPIQEEVTNKVSQLIEIAEEQITPNKKNKSSKTFFKGMIK